MAWSERVRKTLAEMLVAKTVAVEMYQRDALSVDELKSVHTCKNSSAAAHVLLKILMQQPTNDASMFECFLECLKSTQQQKVYEWITSPGM